MRLLTLVLVAITVSACSDRVPAPTTPTPTPRPGYPPAPVSELPEGVLFVQQPSSGPPLLFGIGADGEAQAYVRGSMFAGSPDGARAAFVAMEKGPNGAWLATGVGVLTGAGYKAIVQGGWEPTTMPVFDWSLDGKSFAYTQPDEVAKDRLQVWVVDADTGATRQLTTEPDFYSLLGWAATAEVLVSTSQGLMLVGKKPHPIELPEPGSIVDVEISPDGRSVAVKLGEYEQDPQTQLTYINSTGIWLLEISKGAWRELLDLADEPPGAQTTGGQGDAVVA